MADSAEESLGGVPVQWPTFLDTPPSADPSAARVVVIPVPYDGTASYRGGARHGPRAIIAASRHLEDYDLELDRDVSLVGIRTTPEVMPDVSGPEALVGQVRRAVGPAARQGKLVALLGGEHTITIGSVQALAETHPDISVLYLDAHADLRDSYMGSAWGHASVARRLLDICPVVHVGVRSLSGEEIGFARSQGLPVFFWPTAGRDARQLAEEAVSSLSPSVYVSVDLDVFDPSVMPAVGTPEPGGMGWQEVLDLLRTVAQQRRIVGFDITELSPEEGPEASAFTAAKLAYKLIGYATCL